MAFSSTIVSNDPLPAPSTSKSVTVSMLDGPQHASKRKKSFPAPPVMVSAPAAADQHLGGGVAGERITEPVADDVDGGRSGQRHVVDDSLGTGRIREVDRDRGLDSVDAARTGGGFIDHIADIVDHIGVVAAKAAHSSRRRRRRSACWRRLLPVSVLASALPVALMAAVPVNVRCLDHASGMDRIREAEGDGGLNQIGSVRSGGTLVDHVAGLSTCRCRWRRGRAAVGAGAAVDRISGGVADNDVDEFVASRINRRRADQ